MPYKAKLVTRSTDTSTVTEDTLNKGSALTHGELDSDLINLRDQSIGIASDDSTVIDVGMGNTLTIAGGAGISTTVAGQTVTIAADGTITIVGDDSTGTPVTIGETFKIAGAVGITTAVSGDTLTITGPSLASYITASSTDTLTNKTINLSSNTLTGTIAQFNTAVSDQDLATLAGTETLTNKTLTSPVIAQIVSASNGDIELAPDGTGNVNLNADTVRVGDSNANATITTNGTGDLILNTNAGTNSGTITIEDAANGNIRIVPNGTGLNILGDDYTLANTDNFDNITNNFPDVGEIAGYKGNLLFYSNLAVANKTAFADREFINNRVAYGKAESGITFNDTDFRFRHSDITHFDMNGATADSTVTNSLSASIGANHTTVQIANTAGGTKTAPTLTAFQGFEQIQQGHGGDLTVVSVNGFRSIGTIAANTGEFSRITNAYGFRADTWGTGGTGANGTNRFITNEFAFYDNPTSQSSLITNHYGLYINSGSLATNKYGVVVADAAYINTIGGITLQNGAISTADSTAIQIDESVNVSGTLNAKILVANEISSEDSSAIQINEAVNVSGALTTHGSTTFNSFYRDKINSLTSSTTITVDANLAPTHKVTLGTNTAFVISNLPTGGNLTLIIVQDATGSRTATFGTDGSTAVKFAGGTSTLSTAANSIDIVNIYNDGTNYYGSLAKAFA